MVSLNTNQDQEKTSLGTIIHSEWDRTYVAVVIEAERTARHPICGAMTKDGSPCLKIPKEEHDGRCGWHREGKIAAAAISSAPLKKKPMKATVLDGKFLQRQFGRCNICPVRTGCVLFYADDYCKIEEAFFDEFVRESKSYGTSVLDDFMIMQAGLAFLRSMRANQTFARLGVVEAEDTKIAWQVVRESKEFRDTMKDLGLTRKERIDQDRRREDDASKHGGGPSASLAEIMSLTTKQLQDRVSEVTLERATVKLKGEEEKEEKEEFDSSDEGHTVISTDEEPESLTKRGKRGDVM